MNHYGVILRQLRLHNKLQIKEAAARIERSAGWLSEIENGKGSARIFPQEFERIVAVYGGDAHRKQFGIWVAKAHKPETATSDVSFGGAVLRYLRKKVKMSIEAAAREVGISNCYLSNLETGVKPLSSELRDRLMRIYGYSPSSFKNFTTEDKRAKNIPIRYKLNMLLKQMDEARIEKVFGFAVQMTAAPATSHQSSP
jgi:transcriptional regulator with XRE-family HTH domain